MPTNAPIPTVALPPGFPTLIPAPTLTPAPTSTPRVIAPPDDFGIGDPVLAGAGPLCLQLRLLDVQVVRVETQPGRLTTHLRLYNGGLRPPATGAGGGCDACLALGWGSISYVAYVTAYDSY